MATTGTKNLADLLEDGRLVPLLTADEAAAIGRVTGKHVRALVRDGKVTGGHVGASVRVNTRDWLRYCGLTEADVLAAMGGVA